MLHNNVEYFFSKKEENIKESDFISFTTKSSFHKIYYSKIKRQLKYRRIDLVLNYNKNIEKDRGKQRKMKIMSY